MRVDRIKALLTAEDVLERFGVEIRHGRCKGFCHSGHDLNMVVREDHCYCYVCGKAFDIFDIVMFLTECTFPEAVDKLGFARRLKFSERRKSEKVMRRKSKVEQLNAEWRRLMDEWVSLDKILLDYREGKNRGKLTDAVEFALKHITVVEHRLDCALDEIYRLSNRRAPGNKQHEAVRCGAG